MFHFSVKKLTFPATTQNNEFYCSSATKWINVKADDHDGKYKVHHVNENYKAPFSAITRQIWHSK